MVGFPALYAYIRVYHLSCLCAFMHVSVGFLPRMQVSSIEGRFDRQKSIRSKTATLLKCIELTIYQICLRIFLEPGPQGTANSSLSIELFCCGIILLPIRNAEKETPTIKEIENRVSSSRILHRAIFTQHKNFYYYLYAFKTVVFIIIYLLFEGRPEVIADGKQLCDAD